MKISTFRSSSSVKVLSTLMLGLFVGLNAEAIMASVSGPTEHKGIEVGMLQELSEETLKATIGLEGYTMRMRYVTVEPGGQIAEHSHADRPGIVAVVDGELIEGKPNGETTYAHDSALTFAQVYQETSMGEAYESFPETEDTVHWIYNRSDKPATALVCDLAKL